VQVEVVVVVVLVVVLVVTAVVESESSQHRASGSAEAAVGNIRRFWRLLPVVESGVVDTGEAVVTVRTLRSSSEGASQRLIEKKEWTVV